MSCSVGCWLPSQPCLLVLLDVLCQTVQLLACLVYPLLRDVSAAEPLTEGVQKPVVCLLPFLGVHASRVVGDALHLVIREAPAGACHPLIDGS